MITDMRSGFGWDVHRFEKGRALILCGVKIPHEEGGLLGHSDADAPVHALIDALLGALALGDIGRHFPDTDQAWKGADSILLLKTVLAFPEFGGWTISNIDLTIVTQKPRLAPHIGEMRNTLSAALALPAERVSVKAKTAEGLDAVGRMEALEAYASVLLIKRDKG